MKWISKNRKNKILNDYYSYYKYREIRINKKDYAKICNEINSNFKKYIKGKNKLVLYSDIHKRYYKYSIYYENYNKFVIISRRKDNNL